MSQPPSEITDDRIARWCSHGDHSVPKENYLLKKGICVDCRAKIVDEKAQAAKLEEAKVMFGQLIETTERGQRSVGIKLEAVLDAMYDRFGGVEGFTNAMFAQIQTALTHHPGKSFVLKFFVDIMRLTNASNRLQHAQEVADLTDDQLKRELQLEAMRMVSGNVKFDLMMKALQASGVDIEPPAITEGMSVTEFVEKVEANASV